MSIASPFKVFANATLRFKVATGAVALDGKGRSRPTTEIIEVLAMLNQSAIAEVEPIAGVDPSAIPVQGWVVEVIGEGGSLLPPAVVPETPCTADWQGRSGRFYLAPLMRSSYGDTEILGDELKGYFQPSTFVAAQQP